MTYKENLFEGKSFLVTGCSSGLGLAVSNKLIGLGGYVVGISRTKPPWSDSVSRHIVADLTTGLPDLHKYKFDGIFHAAGTALVEPTGIYDRGRVRVVSMAAIVAEELLGYVALRRGSIVKSGGSVVMVSSVAAHRSAAYMTDYAASRAAIEAMCRATAVELAPCGIRVNALTCGGFNSPMHEKLLRGMSAAGAQKYADRHPLGIGHVDAVADAGVFLLSDAARWITGTSMVVDGGFLAA